MAKGVLKWVLYAISAGFIVLGGLFLMAAFPPYEYRLIVNSLLGDIELSDWYGFARRSAALPGGSLAVCPYGGNENPIVAGAVHIQERFLPEDRSLVNPCIGTTGPVS